MSTLMWPIMARTLPTVVLSCLVVPQSELSAATAEKDIQIGFTLVPIGAMELIFLILDDPMSACHLPPAGHLAVCCNCVCVCSGQSKRGGRGLYLHDNAPEGPGRGLLMSEISTSRACLNLALFTLSARERHFKFDIAVCCYCCCQLARFVASMFY